MAMIQDFSVAMHSYINPNTGECKPQILFVGSDSDITYLAEDDGLTATMVVSDVKGNPAMLTALFKMSYKEAKRCIKKHDLPIRPGQPFSVIRLIDRVTGRSGERYARFKIAPQSS